MSRKRHEMKRADGGKVVYAGAGSNVLKEAEERKRGGKVKHHEVEGDEPKKRMDHKARNRGGAVAGRKRGGGIGANLTPLSTAARTTKIKGEEAGTEGGGHKGENVPNP